MTEYQKRLLEKANHYICVYENLLLCHNKTMSLLELQKEMNQLSFHERAELLRQLQLSLSQSQIASLEPVQPRISWAGIGASGIGDLSERMDELLSISGVS
jgi:hypothetical protein